MRIAAAIVFALGWIPVFRYRSEHVQSKLAVVSRAECRWIPLTITAGTLHIALCLAQRCRQDEEAVQHAFGAAYADYTARTPRRLVPFVW